MHSEQLETKCHPPWHSLVSNQSNIDGNALSSSPQLHLSTFCIFDYFRILIYCNDRRWGVGGLKQYSLIFPLHWLTSKYNIGTPQSDVRRYRPLGQTEYAWNPQLSDKFGCYFTVRAPRDRGCILASNKVYYLHQTNANLQDFLWIRHLDFDIFYHFLSFGICRKQLKVEIVNLNC